MRRLYGGREFFSFYEHLSPTQAVQMMEFIRPAWDDLVKSSPVGSIFPQVALMTRPRSENEEQLLNGSIGIA